MRGYFLIALISKILKMNYICYVIVCYIQNTKEGKQKD